MSMNYCCHEASHVCDAIEEYTDLEHGGEPSAYLMGWIASCINKARLGIGDFVELKDKEKLLMKPIIVIEIPLGMGIDREITEPYGYDLFYGDENIEAQWEKLEELRETGGVIVVQPSHTSAVREILNPYIGEDGFIKECGLRKVHTEEHGDFCIILYHNPSEVMALRAFYLNSKKK